MRIELLCPACGACNFDFEDYESVVLLAPNLALMQFSCARCKIHLSATIKLTAAMQRILQKKLELSVASEAMEAAAEAAVAASADGTAAGTGATATKDDRPGRPCECATQAPQGVCTARPPQNEEDPCSQEAAPCVGTKAPTLSYSSSLIVDGYGYEYGIVRPLKTAAAELKEELEYFKDQLDTMDSVDQVIQEISDNLAEKDSHKKRDL